MKHCYSRCSTPAYTQSENGPPFRAELTEKFIAAGYTIHVFSTPEHPRTNGLVERQNRTLINLLRIHETRHVFDWDQYLNEAVGVYNGTVHASTGFTPFQLLTGQEKQTPLGYYFPEYVHKKFRTKQDYISDTLKRQ